MALMYNRFVHKQVQQPIGIVHLIPPTQQVHYWAVQPINHVQYMELMLQVLPEVPTQSLKELLHLQLFIQYKRHLEISLFQSGKQFL